MDIGKLNEFQAFAIELAINAGKQMSNASGERNKNIEQKCSFADLVTEFDKSIEKYLFTELREKYSEHKFIGEETTDKKIDFTDEPTWIIDPIDGTMNFVHTFPFACVSIGLAIGKRIVLGIVYSPFLNRLYTAIKGCGAFCNGIPIHVNTTCDSLSNALIITELGNQRDEEQMAAFYSNFKEIAFQSHGVRFLGSAALDMCTLASGGADAYWEYGLHCWDIAGASIIVEEAGGCIRDTEGGEVDIMSRRVLAACNTKIADELSKSLKVHLKLERD